MEQIKKSWKRWRGLSSRQKKWTGCGTCIMIWLCCISVGVFGSAMVISKKTATPKPKLLEAIPTTTLIERIQEIIIDTPIPTVINYASQTPIQQPTQLASNTSTQEFAKTSVPTSQPIPIYTKTPIPTSRPSPIYTKTPRSAPHPTATRVACCKHCGSNSKPCGDSCISKKYTCHKPPGCACP